DTARGHYDAALDFSALVPLKLTHDLDRHLRSSKILVVFADEVAKEFIYGYCKIPLEPLARNEAISETINVQTAQGVSCGSVQVHLRWEEPYYYRKEPIITLLDDEHLKQELESGSADVAPKAEAIVLKLNELRINVDNEAVKSEMAASRQLFAGIDFLGLPGELLETESVVLGPEGALDFNFEKRLVFDEIIRGSSSTAQTLEKLEKDELVVSIVDEPPVDSDSKDCIDIAFGSLPLSGIQQGQSVTIPLFSRRSKLEIGYVAVQLDGLEDFKNYCSATSHTTTQ
ncbi:hypothetical protein HDV03_003064, partial [Kappamyces sp. JEL0829]